MSWSEICSVDYLKSKGLINPIVKEVSSNTTCATYNKIDNDKECHAYESDYRGNITCAIGYDDY